MAMLYTNENIPRQVAAKLREYGHDVLTVAESGNAGTAFPDNEVLEFAHRQNRILVTLNRRHFIRLHTDDALHSGIIACTTDSDFRRQATAIDDAIKNQACMQGKLIRINRPR